MTSTNPVQANIHVVAWRSPGAEAKGMAAKILENHQRYSGEGHLVMVTRRQFGYQLREEIHALSADLKVDLSFSESLLEEWIAREAFLFFCLIADPDAPTWRAWLGYRDSPPADTPIAPNRNASSYLAFLRSCGDMITGDSVRALSLEDRATRRGGGGLHLWDRARRYRDLADSLDWGSLPPEELIEEAFGPARWTSRPASHETALLDLQVVKDKAQSLLREFRVLRPRLNERELLREIARQVRYRIATREPFVGGEDVDIQVSTLWGAKGVTATHVYVLGLVDQAIPGARRDEYPGTEHDFVEEQRRLFYVSLTRSRRTLVLSRFRHRIRRTAALKLGLRVPAGSSDWVRIDPSRFLVDAMEMLPQGIPGEHWAGCA
jgi:hypothetical protein